MKLFGRVIIRNTEGKFLVMHNAKRDRWEFPGGKKDELEISTEACAMRELFEETGLMVVGPLTHVTRRAIFVDGDEWTGDFFYGRLTHPDHVEGKNVIVGEPQIQEPHKFKDMQWVTANELNRLPQIPYICVDLARMVEYNDQHDAAHDEHPHNNC